MTTTRSSLPACGVLALSLALVFIVPTPNAEAALIAYDGFNTYAAGDLGGNNSGSGWTGAWGTATAANDVVAGGLDYNGGSISIDGGANNMQKSSGAGGLNADPYFNRSFTPTSSTEVWMSLLLQQGNLSGTDFLEFYLSDAAAENNSGAVVLSYGAAGVNKLGVRANSSSGNSSAFGGGAPTAGTTYLLVMRISGDGAMSATNYDRVEYWLNATSQVLGTATASIDLDMGMASLSYFGMRANALSSGDVFAMDELRIGTTVTDVVGIPEPGLGTLLGVSALGIFLIRRRSEARWKR